MGASRPASSADHFLCDLHALTVSLPAAAADPILAYGAESEINNLVWPRSNPDWVTVAFNDKLQVLRV